jgi:hypothetical protein
VEVEENLHAFLTSAKDKRKSASRFGQSLYTGQECDGEIKNPSTFQEPN